MSISYKVIWSEFDYDLEEDHGNRYFRAERTFVNFEDAIAKLKEVIESPHPGLFSPYIKKIKTSVLPLTQKEQEKIFSLRGNRNYTVNK